jgi:hypothetical protein
VASIAVIAPGLEPSKFCGFHAPRQLPSHVLVKEVNVRRLPSTVSLSEWPFFSQSSSV